MTQTNDSNGEENGANTQTTEIQMKCCPKCKTIIRKTKIFNSLIQQLLSDVDLVKQLHYGNKSQNQISAQLLRDKIYEYYLGIGGEDYFQRKVKSSRLRRINFLNINRRAVDPSLLSKLSKVARMLAQTSRQHISKSELLAIENKFEIIKKLIEFKNYFWNLKNSRRSNRDFHSIDKYLNLMEIRFNKFLHYIDYSYDNNKQQTIDSKFELNCFAIVSETMKQLNETHFNEEGRNLLINAFELLSNFGPFTDVIKDQFKSLVDKTIKLQGLGISQEEKEMVLKTMNFNKEH